jgi:hypothetical protein
MNDLPPIDKRVITWMFSGDTGMSSKAICAHMLGLKYDKSHPSDPSDLGRCLRLLELIPEWKPRIQEMAQHCPGWAGLIGDWGNIVDLYYNEGGVPPAKRVRSIETYRAMKLAIANGYRNDARFVCTFAADGTLFSASRVDQTDDEEESELAE